MSDSPHSHLELSEFTASDLVPEATPQPAAERTRVCQEIVAIIYSCG